MGVFYEQSFGWGGRVTWHVRLINKNISPQYILLSTTLLLYGKIPRMPWPFIGSLLTGQMDDVTGGLGSIGSVSILTVNRNDGFGFLFSKTETAPLQFNLISVNFNHVVDFNKLIYTSNKNIYFFDFNLNN